MPVITSRNSCASSTRANRDATGRCRRGRGEELGVIVVEVDGQLGGEDGMVLADSHGDPASMESHADRPEVTETVPRLYRMARSGCTTAI